MNSVNGKNNGQLPKRPSRSQQQQQQKHPLLAAKLNKFEAVSAQPSASATNGQPSIHRKRQNLDKLLLNEIGEIYPIGKTYSDLLSMEEKLDSLVMRKRASMQDAYKRPMKIKKKLRLYISHIFHNGNNHLLHTDASAAVPTWELRIEGRLAEEYSQNVPPSQYLNAQNFVPANNEKKFSTFFKSIVIDLDKNIYGPDNLVEWHRTPNSNPTDGFQIKRPGDQDVRCIIILSLDHQPLKFKLPFILSKLLGISVGTRSSIIEAFWEYIKTHHLQDSKEFEWINLDERLEKVFRTKRIRFSEVSQHLQQVLAPCDPLIIQHTIYRKNFDKPVNECYEIDVEIDDPLKAQMSRFFSSTSNEAAIQSFDNKLYDISDQVREWKQRVDFYNRFSNDPLNFVNKWLKSQHSDHKVMTGINNELENERRAERYMKSDMKEGVSRYLFNQLQQKRRELELGICVRK